MMVTFGRPFREVADLIRDEARKALELDPSDPGPRYLLGAVAASYDYDWKEAGEHFRAALAAPSVGPNVHWAYASFFLQPWGRYEEAVAEMQLEVDRDPLNVFSRSVLSAHLIKRRGTIGRSRTPQAIEIAENTRCRISCPVRATPTLKVPEAIDAERASRGTLEHRRPELAGALACVGEKSRAEELVRQMGDTPRPIWNRVEYHLLCSEIDAAADWYEKVIVEREPYAIFSASAPDCKALRQSARWPKLAKMMNMAVGEEQ
jgi:tetratricopeptide (TPR) repeat protein